MKKFKTLMGLCPIEKFVFSNEDAVKYKKLLQQELNCAIMSKNMNKETA